MQVRDNETQLLYGLFQGICTWAMEKGYKDISGMKNLLKLAMVDTCRQKHADKSSFATQMAIVTDLGISLRNVQYTLKRLEDLKDISSDYVKIREIQKEITVTLLRAPQTDEEILAEVSYLIHAPHDLQKRTLRTILTDMVQKGVITAEVEDGITSYKTEKSHVDLFDMTDLSARVSGLLTHIDVFNHTVGKPVYKTFQLEEDQARGLQTAINEFLRGTGNALEHECREAKEVTKPYYFYLGSAPVPEMEHPPPLPDAILKVVQARFADPESASLLRNHWYQLTPASAKAVFNEVSSFLKREGVSAMNNGNAAKNDPFVFYFGMADRQLMKSEEEI